MAQWTAVFTPLVYYVTELITGAKIFIAQVLGWASTKICTSKLRSKL
jgi:DMSO reductase anchor subunit